MLVLTRRPGESVVIGDQLTIMVVDTDWRDLEARLAISAIDANGNDLRLQASQSRTDARVVNVFDATG